MAKREEVEAWLTDLVVGRPYRLQARLFEARSQLGSWSAVCSRLGPVITAMGEAWERGELSVVEEHLASERLSRALNAVGETLRVADDAPRALLMTVESEEHTLGLSLLELALRELGWAPIWCGRRSRRWSRMARSPKPGCPISSTGSSPRATSRRCSTSRATGST